MSSRTIYILVFITIFTVIPVMGQITNGDFETGDFTGWTVTGPHNADVIQHLGSWCGHIHINSGSASNSGTPTNMYQMVTQEIVVGGVMNHCNSIWKSPVPIGLTAVMFGLNPAGYILSSIKPAEAEDPLNIIRPKGIVSVWGNGRDWWLIYRSPGTT